MYQSRHEMKRRDVKRKTLGGMKGERGRRRIRTEGRRGTKKDVNERK